MGFLISLAWETDIMFSPFSSPLFSDVQDSTGVRVETACIYIKSYPGSLLG